MTVLAQPLSAVDADNATTRMLADYPAERSELDWFVVNDNVMGGRSQGGFKIEQGELFFGGNNGYNAFEPSGLHASVVVPAVMLTAFHNMSDPTKSDLPIDENEGVDLGSRDDVVPFEFAALDFAAPSKNQYAYKLEGFDISLIARAGPVGAA